MAKTEMCACGRPLHYSSPAIEEMVNRLIREAGPQLLVKTPNGSWLVPRHYVALHGLRALDLPKLGFPEA